MPDSLLSALIVAVPSLGAIIALTIGLKKLREAHKALTETSTQQHAQLAQGQASLSAQNAALADEATRLKERLGTITDLDSEREKLQAEVDVMRAKSQAWVQNFKAQRDRMEQEAKARQEQSQSEIASLQAKVDALRHELSELEEVAHLQSFGFYQAHYDFGSAQEYQAQLERIRAQQKEMLRNKSAAVCHMEWLVNGSRTEGKKQIDQTLTLLLRAFNGECDAAIAKVRYNNIVVMEERIKKAFKALTALVHVQNCSISSAYLDLKLEELHLVHEYQEKLQDEKEEQRAIRERIRDEEIARRQWEREQQKAEQDAKRYEEALARARQEADQAVGARQQQLLSQVAHLQQQLAEALANRERAIAQAQLTKLGHVYIISNIGSFANHVYKIGMTRRLDPKERVNELGDASVPFPFDIHAMIVCDDAPALEAALHRHFERRRVNHVNRRKEFYRATIDEIAEAARRLGANLTDLSREPEAKDYRETLSKLKALGSQSGGSSNGTSPARP